jgi:hypothetical protein
MLPLSEADKNNNLKETWVSTFAVFEFIQRERMRGTAQFDFVLPTIRNWSVSALLAEAYTATLYVMVNRVEWGLRAPSPAWANFSIMMECTPESGSCHSVCMYSVM